MDDFAIRKSQKWDEECLVREQDSYEKMEAWGKKTRLEMIEKPKQRYNQKTQKEEQETTQDENNAVNI